MSFFKKKSHNYEKVTFTHTFIESKMLPLTLINDSKI